MFNTLAVATLGPIILVIFVVVFVLVFLFFARFAALFIQAATSGAPVPMSVLVGMWLRKVDARKVVMSYIRMTKAGVPVSLSGLEIQYLARGDVEKVADAMIIAHHAGMPLAWDTACAIDLAGRDLQAAVEQSLEPKTFPVPWHEPDARPPLPVVTAESRDGRPLQVRVHVTVTANLDRLIGGATEQTLANRVATGIEAFIGQAESHRDVLEHPEELVDYLMASGYDTGTAFVIHTIEIAQLDAPQTRGIGSL